MLESWLIWQTLKVMALVFTGTIIFLVIIWKVLDKLNRKELMEDKCMLIDILQELYDAIRDCDERNEERCYSALESLGMERATANEVLKAGVKFFSRFDIPENTEEETEIIEEDSGYIPWFEMVEEE